MKYDFFVFVLLFYLLIESKGMTYLCVVYQKFGIDEFTKLLYVYITKVELRKVGDLIFSQDRFNIELL